MLLTIQDCEAAAQVIAGFLRDEPKRPPVTIEGRTRASVSRLRERAVTPSGKLLELYELRARNQTSPHLVKLCFYPSPTPPQRRVQKSIVQSSSETVEYLTPDGTTYRAPVLRRDRSGVQQRRQEEDVRFHVLLPEQRTPTTLDGQRTGRPQCPTCRCWFAPAAPEQRYCCRVCATGKKPKKGEHADECTMTALPHRQTRWRRKMYGDVEPTTPSRWRRKMYGDVLPVPATPSRRWEHLIAAEDGDTERIFLQLVIYAARAGWCNLAAYEDDEVFRRFEVCFQSSVNRLPPGWEGTGPRETVKRDLLSDTWMAIKKEYRLPGTTDGFSRYVRYTIKRIKRSAFSHKSHSVENAPPENTAPSPWEVAAITKIPISTVYNLIDRGILPATRSGRITCQPGWREAIDKHQEKQEAKEARASKNHNLAVAWSNKTGCRLESAQVQIRRWWQQGRRKGLEEGEISEWIAQRIGPEWLKGEAQTETTKPCKIEEVTFDYDSEEDSLVILLDPEGAVDSSHELDRHRCVWYATDGSPVKIELLNVSHGVTLQGLPERKIIKQGLNALNISFAEANVS